MSQNMDIKAEIQENLKPSKSGEVLFPNENRYSHIKNKQVRNQQFQKKKREAKKVKRLCTSSFILHNYSILFRQKKS